MGGPIVKDKAWFFVAYNHFHINKELSGVDPSIATSLGIFDTFTTKETYKPSNADTLIGYYQWDKKNEPTARPVVAPRSATRSWRRSPRAGCTTASGSGSGRTACSPK